jgi:hypothetical protein
MNIDQSQDKSTIDIPKGLTKEWLVSKAKHLNQEFDKWFQANILPEIDENARMFEGKLLSGVMQSGVNIPAPDSVVETAAARFMGPILGREAIVDAVQKLANDPDEQGKQNQITVKDLINEAITNVPNFIDKCDEMFRLVLVERMCVLELSWEQEEIQSEGFDMELDPVTRQPLEVPEINPETGEPMEQVEHSNKSRRFPDFTPDSIRNWKWDPRQKWRIEDSPWACRRMMVSANDLLKLQEAGQCEGVDYIIEQGVKADPNNTQKDADAARAQNVEGYNLPSIKFDDGIFQLDRFWATLTWKDGGKLMTDEFVFWLVGEEHLIKFEKNPYKKKLKPIATAKIGRRPGVLQGKSPLDVIKDMVKDMQNNMARKNRLIARAANTPTFYEPSSGLDGRKTILQENSLIPVLNVKGIHHEPVPVDAIKAVDSHLSFDLTQIREATASNEVAQGVATDGDSTATEINALGSAASTRFQYMFEMVMNSVFPRMAYVFYQMYKDFSQPGDMVVRDAGVAGASRSVTLEELSGDYEFRAISGQSFGQKLNRFRLLMPLFQQLAQASIQNPMMFKDKNGQPMQLLPYEFLTEQLLPLIDIKASTSLFQPMQAPPTGMMPPGMPGQMPPGGPPGPPAGGPPMSMRPEQMVQMEGTPNLPEQA